MDTSRLKKFAQYARRSMIEQVESKLKLVLAEESAARREHPQAITELEKKLKAQDEAQLIEQVAYIWFNRFCALRFMDVNQYNRIMVISPLAGQFQPEILAEAKAGHIDEGMVNEAIREKVFGLLSGSITSRDGQSEAFRQLIVAVCNDLHRIMPYLFERIEDYTELLMPDDLLSGNSILAYTREAMTPEACESVESIGWLYQFYISEKKDEVFDGLKKNKKITPENIPAATQLFTPHWIVRYLVENSLGRLWMLNNPSSKVIEKMDYYIKPVEKEKNFLKISCPEEIKICDPACGSGHMLTYAYDLLYAIYLDAGYDATEIPEKILTNNLYGIEIDERAAELAAFALTMKAVKGNPLDEGNNRRRFFRNPVAPHICRLEKVAFTADELDGYIDFVGKDLFTQDLRATLKEFEEADNFGSLIQPTLKTPADALAALEAKDVSGELFLADTHKSVLKILEQADYLSQKYHAVVANPPYMTSSGMNQRLSVWGGANYKDAKADLFSMFICRNTSLILSQGYVGMITMHSWMFLPSFEKFRCALLRSMSLQSMAHLGARAFDSIGGQVVATTAFVFKNENNSGLCGDYIRLVDIDGEKRKETKFLEVVESRIPKSFFTVGVVDLEKVPGCPVAYWVSDKIRESFENNASYNDKFDVKAGISTGNNEKFILTWQEIDFSEICSEPEDGYRYTPHNKGGEFRKWFGNTDYILKYSANHLLEMEKNAGFRHDGREYYFKPHIGWTKITSTKSSFRMYPSSYTFDSAGLAIFSDTPQELEDAISFLNSNVSSVMLNMLNPTLNVTPQILKKLPYIPGDSQTRSAQNELIRIAQEDWDTFEYSMNFKHSPFLSGCILGSSISSRFMELTNIWEGKVSRTLELEKSINEYYVAALGLEGEVGVEVPEDEISLSCNRVFRYGAGKSASERLGLLQSDTMKEFISYSIGCMLGRYSLDKEGLILANQGDTLNEYLKQVPQPSFMPDDDNVIPLIDFDGDWFEDDITERFKQFLKVSFGEEHFAENLAFIEEAIGKDIKKFFLKDFYVDHVKRYKKRPIYWMFSSQKGSFNALIYMHRYRPDAVSVVLNDYLREFRTKLQARKESYEQIEVSVSVSQKEKTQAIKAIQKINKVLDEVNDYERDVLYPLAGKPPEIDLDDGVKHNYPLFGKALKKVSGLS